jgi:endonuclease YncB( thermonuclease family)
MKRNLSNIYTRLHGKTVIPTLIVMLLSSVIVAYAEKSVMEEGNDEATITSSLLNGVKVVDGDSLEIGAERIRFLGIDAPEYLQKCKTAQNKDYACGREAQAYLKDLIGSNKVTCISHKRDIYERHLATCYVGETNLNREMVRSGHAVVYLADTYQAEETLAKAEHVGIWQGKFIRPRLYRKKKAAEKRQNF